MSGENKSTNDLYREVIELQKEWREENKALLADNQTAISTLNSLQKKYEISTRLIIGLVATSLIVCVSILVYKGKVKLCTVEFSDLILTTNNCLSKND